MTDLLLAQLETYRNEAYSLLRARAYPQARALYEKLLDHGTMEAACCLGWMYSQIDNPEYDRDKAISYYKISAETGDTYAQYGLGALLAEVGKRDEALKWYRKASELGHSTCSFLAFRELAARGDSASAEAYLHRAVEQGNPAAIQRQSILKIKGRSGAAAILPGLFQYLRNVPRMARFIIENVSPPRGTE